MLVEKSPDDKTRALKLAALCGIATTLVLVIFQPFGTYESALTYKYLRLAGYGLVTFCAIYLAALVSQALPFQNWGTGFQKASFVTVCLILAAVFNHGYFSVVVLGSWHWQNQLLFFYYVAAIALVPVAIIYVRSAKPVDNASTVETEPASEQVTIIGENKSDVLNVALNDIVAFRTADNYCEVLVAKGESVSTHILRATLSSILEQLPEQSPIFRCHRSHAANLTHVRNSTGNANGLKLGMAFADIEIPVSRSYVKPIREALSLIPKSS